jgi:hypothetical protein
MKLVRTQEYIETYCEILQDMGLDYTIRHGTYTTSIIHANGKRNFSCVEFSKMTFIAAQKVKKDVLNSPFYQEIKDMTFDKQNYDFNKDLRFITSANTYNIDINKAYAHCLLTHNLITSETFDFIQKLPKAERLVCVGMLARSYTDFKYIDGQLDGVDFHREPTANVFFFLINEINRVMKDCQFYLGKHFYFYWVDGIFFSEQTPSSTIRKVEGVLEYFGYPYKYEKIDFFDYKYDCENAKIEVNLKKDNENKCYNWGVDEEFDKIKKHLNNDAKKKQKRQI